MSSHSEVHVSGLYSRDLGAEGAPLAETMTIL